MLQGRIALVFVGLLTLVSLACSQTKQEAKAPDLTAIARAFVEQLNKGEFAAAIQRFDATMLRVMPLEKTRETWQALLGQVGAFQQQVGMRTAKAQGYEIVFVTCEFARAKIDIKLVFDAQQKIAGLFFVPTEDTHTYTSAPYVKPDSFTERAVTVGGEEWALPGTLTLPKGEGPFSALVLVHGSGPQDRDETIGPNKPFRDLAEGLASQGLAVLRYEKRTKAYPQKLATVQNLTVNDETVDDAAAAVKLLQSTASIDPHRIFVLGHSLGGMVLGRIAKAVPQIRGLIAVAGGTRPLDAVIIEQMTYIATLNGAMSEADRKNIDTMKQDLARLNDPNIAQIPNQMIQGLPVSYWLDLRKIDPPAEAKKISQPILIVQGGHDYQVTEQDFANWKAALSGRKDVVFKFYPNLFHLFIPGEKAPSAYEKPGHVDKSVVDDIATWMKERS